MILPVFGGAQAVWSVSLVFFQAVLLLGYAYANAAPRRLGDGRQRILHLVLAAIAAATLLASVGSRLLGADPTESPLPPALFLLLLLLTTIGLPYFVVSTGAPLLQRWFSKTAAAGAEEPYFLYAASNAGSLAGLLAYPFFIETRFAVLEQAQLWISGYLMLVVLLALCAWRSRPEVAVETERVETPVSPRPALATRLRWIALSAVPASLLIGVTSYLTTNVAAIPLLWIIPLSLYLVTFIIAFRRRGAPSSSKISRWLALLMAPMAVILALEATDPFVVLAAVHLTVFFLGSLACHSELSETRPAADHLTEFYLMLSIGGVIGGAFNALLAPLIFVSITEYPLALICLLALRYRPGALPDKLRFNAQAAVWPLAITSITLILALAADRGIIPYGPWRTGLVYGLPVILAFILIERPLSYALALGGVLVANAFVGLSAGGKMLHAERSFYGVHRVVESSIGKYRSLVHGVTIHGRQNTDPVTKMTPITYYHPDGPIGQLIQARQPLQPKMNLGLVGLGVGSLAAYGRAEDAYTFYEIDPSVIHVATDPSLFTFLSECRADLNIVEGDARLMLRKAENDQYDVLVIDAFSSDAIPVHLMTVEAIQLYLTKIKPNGVVAFHISNRFLALSKVLVGAIEELGVRGRYANDVGLTEDERDTGRLASQWMLIGKSEAAFDAVRKNVLFDKLDGLEKVRPWTDTRSNILEVWIRSEG